MTARTELESKIVQFQYSPRTGNIVALLADGSIWERFWEMPLWNWVQLHPPHRAPEAKETPSPAPKILRFSEVTKPGAYWVREAVNATWHIGRLHKNWDGLFFYFRDFVVAQTDHPNLFEGYEFVGPFPEPEVGT